MNVKGLHNIGKPNTDDKNIFMIVNSIQRLQMILKSMGVECKKDDMDGYAGEVDEEATGKFTFLQFCQVGLFFLFSSRLISISTFLQFLSQPSTFSERMLQISVS